MRIVDADDSKIQQIAEIERISFVSEFYSLSQLIEMMKNPNYIIKVIIENNIFCGYIIIYKNIDFDEIYKICVKEEFKRNGYGSALVNYAKNNCQSKLFLEVRASNSGAIQFYLSNGFKINGERKGYYSGNENAILLEYIK